MKTDTASLALPALLGFNVPQAFKGVISKLLALDSIGEIYGRIRTDAILPSVVRELNVTIQAVAADRVPSTGPVVVVANHPFGLLDGAVLATLCMRARSDVKVLANQVLSGIPELANVILPVDVFARKAARRNAARVLEAIRHVSDGGLLIVFPSGEVSAGSGDANWSPLVARLIRASTKKAPEVRVLPAFVHGANSRLFRLAGSVHPLLRTALLPRELVNKQGLGVRVDFGNPISGTRLLDIESDVEAIEYLRWRTHLLRRDKSFKPNTRRRVFRRRSLPPAPATICGPTPAEVMEREINCLPVECHAGTSGSLCAYIAHAYQIPETLREIGRLREVTFRAAGEGTGKSIDIDEFDHRYLHLFVWNGGTREVVGAYRIGRVDQIRDAHGPSGLYTTTLFAFGEAFLDELGPALELGRSFVRPEYQRTFAPLLLLWKAIGRYVADHPQYKVLFGPVSISNSYSVASRELMVTFLERRNVLKEMVGLVKSRNPFRASDAHVPAAVELEDVSQAIADIEGTPVGVPVLLRQYLKLGGKLVGFNVDHEFADAVDGLIVVDLTKTEPQLVERYLGRSEARAFFEFHRGNHGANQNHCNSELDAAGHRRSDPAADTLLQVQRRARVGIHLLDAWRRTLGQDR